jgi:hypothetical protein
MANYCRLQWQRLTHDRPDLSSERGPPPKKWQDCNFKKKISSQSVAMWLWLWLWLYTSMLTSLLLWLNSTTTWRELDAALPAEATELLAQTQPATTLPSARQHTATVLFRATTSDWREAGIQIAEPTEHESIGWPIQPVPRAGTEPPAHRLPNYIKRPSLHCQLPNYIEGPSLHRCPRTGRGLHRCPATTSSGPDLIAVHKWPQSSLVPSSTARDNTSCFISVQCGAGYTNISDII